MDRPKPLPEDEVLHRLVELPEWTCPDGRTLTRTVSLPHLAAAIMVVHVAEVQNELDHHADIALGYDTVRFETTTHSEGGRLTALDFALAARIDAVAAAHGAAPARP